MNEIQEMATGAASTLGQGVEECWMDLDDARMRYLRAGSGPPLVLLHGLLGYSFSWRYTLPVLGSYATVYAPDMLGAGLSDHPPHLDYTLRASAQRLLRFLDAVGIGSCDLLGASQGGAVVMMAAALAPDRVRRLVLSAPANPWSSQGMWRARVLSSRLVAPLVVRIGPYCGFTHKFLLRRLFGDPRRIRPGALEGYSAQFSVPGAFEPKLALLRSWRRDLAELEGLLPRIADVPTLLLWGGADRAVRPASAKQLGKHFRDCRIQIFDGVGHIPFEEVPEDFNRAVLGFLQN